MDEDELTRTTWTYTANPYDDWITWELMLFVHGQSKASAEANIPLIMAEYERRKSFRTKLRALFE